MATAAPDSPTSPHRLPGRSLRPQDPQTRKDVAFMQKLCVDSSAGDWKRYLKFLKEPMATKPEVLAEACNTAVRMCMDPASFRRFAKLGGLKALAAIGAALGPASEASSPLASPTSQRSGNKSKANKAAAAAIEAREAARRAAAEAMDSIQDMSLLWLQEVDHIDFQELAAVAAVAGSVGPRSKPLAFHSLKTMERFMLQQKVNSQAFLEHGAIAALHNILGEQRAPEIVHMVLLLLFRLTDQPERAAAPFVVAHKELVTMIIEVLRLADGDMRIQLAGFRVLALWAQFGEKKLTDRMREANAHKELHRATQDLLKTGLPHMATWLQTVAGRFVPPPNREEERQDPPAEVP